MHAGAERAALLALPGIDVDPALLEGAVDELGHDRAEAAHDAHQHGPGLVQRVMQMALAHGREQVVELQAALVAEHLRLQAEIAAEHGQALAHHVQQRVQRLAIHAAHVQRGIQHRVVMAQIHQGQRLTLDAVQTRGHGNLDARIGGDFRLVGAAAHVGGRVVGQSADGGEGERLALSVLLEGNHQVRVQIVPQAAPRAAAGGLHPQHRGLQRRVDDVRRALLQLAQQECVLLQHGLACDERVQIVDPAQQAAQRAEGLSALDVHIVHAVVIGARVLVVRVHGEGQKGEIADLDGRVLHALQRLQHGGEALGRAVVGQLVDGGAQTRQQREGLGGLAVQLRVVKSCVELG